MRIGIWCDYGFTLEPSEGIGVYVDNLARGLVRADDTVQIMMMAHTGQEEKLATLVSAGGGRISVVSASGKLPQPKRFCVRWLKKLRNALELPASEAGTRARIVSTLDRVLDRLEGYREHAIRQIIDSCDVWLLPYVGLDREFSKPTVVAIHDLVCYHFPEMLSPDALADLKKVVDKVSRRATIAACMSEFIRDNDLYRTLQLPPSRVRVIKAAVPDDLGMTQDKASDAETSRILADRGIAANEPFLLYPAAFRTYKNHALLVETLPLLKAHWPDRNWRLVFTGIRECPTELTRLMKKHGVENDVLTLGKVSRADLEFLYRKAFATIVPSLYEQGSFPVMEALHCECPVAASNIPSLLEQFRSMGESMLFFDPHNPNSLLEVIKRIDADRESCIDQQRVGFKALQSNTWEDSAKQWLNVLHEAVVLKSSIGELSVVERAA